MDIGISYSDYYLPSNFVSTQEFFSGLENFSLPSTYQDMESFCESYYKQKRIKGIYIEDRKQEVEVFEGLVEKFLDTSGIKPQDVDVIIYTKGVPLHENKVNIPYYIQKKYEFDNAVVFNVEQTCGASLVSMLIAESMIRTQRYRSALILSSSFIKENYKRDVQLTLIGDGAGVLFLEPDPKKLKIEDFLSRTTGSFTYSIESFTKRENYKELVKYLQNGADTIKELLRRNDLTFDAIKLISPQNTTYGGWQIYASLLEITMDKIFLDNIPRGAHIGDVDTIRNITDVTSEERLSPGELMVAYGLGWGTSWNAGLLRMV